MSQVPLKAFIGAIAFGGLAVGGMGVILIKKVDQSANESLFAKRAIIFTREQPAIKQLVGDEIRFGQAKIDGKLEKTNVKIRLPFKGDKDDALLIAYARRKEGKDKFRLFKLEAEFSKIKGKKLVLLDRSSEDLESDEEWEQEQIKLDEERGIGKKPKTAKELAEEERQRVKAMTDAERKRYYLEKMKEMQPKS